MESEILEALRWRYATKRFDPTKKLSQNQWRVLSESLRLAPSAYGLQPWRFIVVQDPVLRKELCTVTRSQSQLTDCSHYVVFTSKTSLYEEYVDQYLKLVATNRQESIESLAKYRARIVEAVCRGMSPSELIAWTQRQAYIAMGMILESCALLHVDSCPIEGLVPTEYDRILELTGTGYATVAAVALGFRAQDDKHQFAAKVRFLPADVIEYR